MKKLLAMTLASAMVLSLAACGGNKPAETKAPETQGEATQTEAAAPETQAPAGEAAHLRFSWWGNQTRTERTEAVLDLYTEQTGVTFDTQAYAFADYFTNLATQGAGNELPDVFQMNDSSHLITMAKAGQLLDFGPYIENGTLDVSNCDPGIINAGSVDGKVYAICIGVNVPALIYNKTLLDELGITIEDNMTTDEFMAVAREVYEKTGIKTDLAYGNATSFMQFAMRGVDVPEFMDETGMTVEDDDVFAPYFDIYQKGHDEGWMIDAATYADLVLNSVEQNPLVYFSSPATQSWCACYWSNQITALSNAAPEGMELAMSTWPAADPVKANFLHPSMYLSVAANSANPEEAVKVVDYFTNSVDCNKILLAERGVPISTAVAADIASELSELNVLEIDFINNVVTPNSSDKSAIPPDGANEFFAYADELCEKVLYGEIDAHEASAKMMARGKELMNK